MNEMSTDPEVQNQQNEEIQDLQATKGVEKKPVSNGKKEIDPAQLEKLQTVAEGFGDLFKNASENKMLFSEMLKDEKVKEAIAGLVRTCLNLGISLVDFVPAIGDAVSWSADLAKMTKFDITPDVSKVVAWGSEGLEALTGGAFPSHAIEGVFQFMKDYPRIQEGIERAEEIWKAHQEAVESPQVSQAANVFAMEGVA